MFSRNDGAFRELASFFGVCAPLGSSRQIVRRTRRVLWDVRERSAEFWGLRGGALHHDRRAKFDSRAGGRATSQEGYMREAPVTKASGTQFAVPWCHCRVPIASLSAP